MIFLGLCFFVFFGGGVGSFSLWDILGQVIYIGGDKAIDEAKITLKNYTNIQSSFTCNNPKLETVQMSFNG